MNKRGTFVDNVGEMIIAAMLIVGLIFVGISFLPEGELGDIISEGYFEKLEEVVDEGGVFILEDREEKDLEFYLVYFGGRGRFAHFGEDDAFVARDTGENVICVCYRDDDGNVCGECLDLKKRAVLEGEGENWVIFRNRVFVEEKEDFYEFKIG